MSNLGKWDSWYRAMKDDDYGPFGSTETYQMAKRFLNPCSRIEDWGCGRGHFSSIMPPGRVVNIDGSKNPHIDKVEDLAQYRSHVPGILMRHVLDHNDEWRHVLGNALCSFTARMVLVLLAPFIDESEEDDARELKRHDIGVPDLAFKRSALETYFKDHLAFYAIREGIPSVSDYHQEIVILLWRDEFGHSDAYEIMMDRHE